MSQILIPRGNGKAYFLFQDLYFTRKKTEVLSTLKEIACAICDKNLDQGISVTAKKIGEKTRFFCQFHFPKDY